MEISKKPVFDIGDTLLPSHEKINEKVRGKVVEAGVEDPPEFPINEYNIYVPEEVNDWLIEQGIDADPEEIKQAYINWEKKYLREKTIPVLKKVAEKFGPIGFVSDNSLAAKKFYTKLFDRAGLEYSGMVVSEEAGVKKPDPDIFRRFLDERDEESGKFVYFGNYIERDNAAEEVGMDFVWVKEHHVFGSDDWSPSISELTFENVQSALKEVTA